ncbi:hypothetical protein SDC9_115954 [bioreactor metagenome]|uniref:Uncharacterized protein n=1 Tax=bioreactor metagenome TaxID=1076179 RepID=A0A645BWJ4_9ZZZZ
MAVCPGIYTVGSDKDGDVPDDLHLVGIGICFELGPLGEEEVLLDFDPLDFPLIGLSHRSQGRGFAQPEFCWPNLKPPRVVVHPAEHLIECIIVKKPGIFVLECFVCSSLVFFCFSKEEISGLLKEGFLICSHLSIVHSVKREDRGKKNILHIKIAVIGEAFQIDEEFVSCKGRTGCIGRVSIPGGPKGKYLPQPDLGLAQEVDECKSLIAQGTNSMGGWQGSRVHQHPTASRVVFHGFTIPHSHAERLSRAPKSLQ